MLWRALRLQSRLPSRQQRAAERGRSGLKGSGPGMGSGMNPGMGPGEERAQMMVAADSPFCCGIGFVRNQVLEYVAEQSSAGLGLISHRPVALDLFVVGLATWRVERRRRRHRRAWGSSSWEPGQLGAAQAVLTVVVHW